MKNITNDNGLAKEDISSTELSISMNLFRSELEVYNMADGITDLSMEFPGCEESNAFTQDLRRESFRTDTLVGG